MDISEKMEELSQSFQLKITGIQLGLQLKNATKEVQNESRNEMRSIYEQIMDCKSLLSNYKKLIEDQRKETEQIKDARKEVQDLNKRITTIFRNLPEDYFHKIEKENVQLTSNIPRPELVNISNKKHVPVIHRLTVQEFSSIPNYMKGRITLERMNEAIDNFNQTISAKYALLAKPKSSLSKKESNLSASFKMQITKSLKGLYFCTAEDLNSFSTYKMDSTGRSIITCLRHCGRIRELREAGCALRYVIVT